jgi:hypothetical protein
MNTTEPTVFNPAQMKLLHMMSFVKTDEELDNLQQAVSSYFLGKVDEEMDKLWDSGDITLDTIESWGNEHMRTAYK